MPDPQMMASQGSRVVESAVPADYVTAPAREPTTIRVFRITELPDPGHHDLSMRCGGDVRAAAFRGAEQLLRMLASFRQAEISVAFRWVFKPGVLKQDRSTLLLAVRASGDRRTEIIDCLVRSGPLARVYDFEELSPAGDVLSVPQDLRWCCEILRHEESFAANEKRRRFNARIPERYYSLLPFEARDDADGMAVDRLLDRLPVPAVIDIVVKPAETSKEWNLQYQYVTELLSINQYGDDPSETVAAKVLSDEGGLLGAGLPSEQRARDPIADDIVREQQELHQTLRRHQLLFHAKCWSQDRESATLLASTLAESSLANGKYQLLSYQAGGDWWDDSAQKSSRLEISKAPRNPAIWREGIVKEDRQNLECLPRLGTVDELKSLFRLPVAGIASPRTIRKKTDPHPLIKKRQDGTLEPHLLLGDDLELDPRERTHGDYHGLLESIFHTPSSEFPELRVSTGLLTKHVFVAGVPGSGKTTALFNLLAQLYSLNPRIPFLVIEPAKTEYRTLKILGGHWDSNIRDLAGSLQIFTPGNENLSPFRFNPLAYPEDEGITLDEHIGTVLSCFQAAMPMSGPLPALMAEAVEKVYEGRTAGTPFPRLKDLYRAACDIMAGKGYAPEVKSNLTAMIEVRLGLLVRRSLGQMFDCNKNVPSVHDILRNPTILEMDYLAPEHACLLTLFVLSAIREQVRVSERSEALAHVVVLEEAHNIVGRTGPAKAGEDSTDPKAFAAAYVARMLAEMRALGEGIVIADQLPSAVAPEVVKNTGTKIAHRLVSKDDRDELGASMLISGNDLEEMARLEPGQAYFYTEGLYLPRRIRGLPSHEYLSTDPFKQGGKPKLPPAPGRQTLANLISTQSWFVAAADDRASAALAEIEPAAQELSKLLGVARERLSWAEEMLKGIQAGETHTNVGESRADLRRVTASLLDSAKAFETKAGPVLDRKRWRGHDPCVADRVRKQRERGLELVSAAQRSAERCSAVSRELEESCGDET